MRNLLRANFSRLRRDGTFWSCVLTVLACSAGFMVLWCLEDADKGVVRDMDTLLGGDGIFLRDAYLPVPLRGVR